METDVCLQNIYIKFILISKPIISSLSAFISLVQNLLQPIFRVEVGSAIAALKNRKSARVDNQQIFFKGDKD